MAKPLDKYRFAPEKDLLEELFERYELDTPVQHYLETGELTTHVQAVWSEQLHISDTLSPRLCSLLDEVKQSLKFEDDVDLFVAAAPELNAFTIPGLTEESDHVISMTSGIVERMSDEELKFVLGHEIGHLAYRHYLTGLVYHAAGVDERGGSTLPALVRNRLNTWQRQAEISADRTGFIAVNGNLEAVVSAFFRLQSGLGPEHLKFDIAAFLTQLDELKGMKRSDLMARFSHPITPIRVRALQLFGEAGGAKVTKKKLASLDARVKELTGLMEREVTKPLEVQARDFLLAGGLLASYSDGEVDEDQTDFLLNILLPLCADPEAAVQKITSAKQAQTMLDESMTWLQENAGEERFYLFRQLAVLVSMDGRLHDKEKEFMITVAEGLGIPEKSADETIHATLRQFIQSKSGSRIPAFFGKKQG
ncbi:MAG: M48 family metalloprotease [Deltaproteobacteria bacterium]|nr:M48 family metalloprotease [Deltaproteobacteria bacterium]